MNQPPLEVLLVDDDPAIRRALRTSLSGLGFRVTETWRGEEALLVVRSKAFDVVLLDMHMPGIGGLETLNTLRASHPRLPILMLTAQDDEDQKVEALDRGADDYVTKPFGIRELVARLRAVARRSATSDLSKEEPLKIGEISLDPRTRQVNKSGCSVRLTPKEYDMLHFLMLNAGRVVTYKKLLGAVWGAEYRDQVDYLRTFMRQLRKKLEDDASAPRYLLTDAYVGYRFAADDQQVV